MFTSLLSERDYRIERITGELPQDLRGTFWRQGPGKYEVGKTSNIHQVDGDGMQCKIVMPGDGSAHFSNRYVRTKGYEREEKEQRVCYRGVYGTQIEGKGWWDTLRRNTPLLGGATNFKNTANTHSVIWPPPPSSEKLIGGGGGSGGAPTVAPSLLALWEGGLPHALDPFTLRTVGLDQMGGVLSEPGSAFSAHPRVDGSKRRLVNFGIRFTAELPPAVWVDVWEWDDEGALVQQHTFRPPSKGVMVHDFALTEDHIVIFFCPVKPV